jgi:hypothetical protein
MNFLKELITVACPERSALNCVYARPGTADEASALC